MSALFAKIKKQTSGTKIINILNCDPLKYKIDISSLILLTCLGQSIKIQRVKVNLVHIFQNLEHPYNPDYQYHGETIIMSDLPAFDNFGYEVQPEKKRVSKDVSETRLQSMVHHRKYPLLSEPKHLQSLKLLGPIV